jgi:hypothetical protein
MFQTTNPFQYISTSCSAQGGQRPGPLHEYAKLLAVLPEGNPSPTSQLIRWLHGYDGYGMICLDMFDMCRTLSENLPYEICSPMG